MVAGPRPLRRDAERNRERIIAAARELFARDGLDVTLDAVAAHAGVGVGTVYRRFADKEELIDAIFEARIAEIAGLAEAGLAVADPWDGLVGFLEAAIELHAADRGLKAVLLSAEHGHERVARGRDRIAPFVTRLVERAQEAGRLRPDAETTDIPLIQFMLGAVAEYTRDVEPQMWRRMLTLVLDGLRPSRAGAAELPVRALTHREFERVMATARL